jgi:uncharacterized caspase-like protein
MGGIVAVQIKFIATLSAFLSFAFLASPSAQAQDPAAGPNPRIALVIGDSAYPDHPLATPANDAGLVAQTLQAAGFDVVGARDLDQNALRGALRDFLDKAAAIGPDMQAFVYLSGRGVQFDGDNYFVPVDARIARGADIPIQAIKISDFSRALAATPGRARIIVMDAARANSFAADGSPLAGGLGLVDPEDGTLMAFNAAPGTIAPDEPGPYGVYGKSLAGAMREGGMPIDDVFAQTRLQVNQQTNGGLVPWSVSKIEEPYAIFERAPDAPPSPSLIAAADNAKRPLNSFGPDEGYSVALQRDTLRGYQEYLAAYPDSPQARRVRAILAARREAIFWRRSVNQNSPRAYWTYLRVYPHGPHFGDAQRRLEILAAQLAPPADFAPLAYEDLPPPPPDELAYDTGPAFVFYGPDYGPPPPPPPVFFLPEQDDNWRNLPPPPPPAGLGFLPVLPVAIPLLAGAALFHKHGAVKGQPGVGAPPPLPQGFKPHDRAPAASGTAPLLLAPSGMGKPLKPVPGETPLAAPLGADKSLKPIPGKATPLAEPLSVGKPLKPVPGDAPLGADKSLKPIPGKATPLAEPSGVARPLATPVEPKVVKPIDRPLASPKDSKPEFKAAPQELKVAPVERVAPPPVRQHIAPVQRVAPSPAQGKQPTCGVPNTPPCPK